MSEQRLQRIVTMVAVGAFASAVAVLLVTPLPQMRDWEAAGFFTLLGLLASALGYQQSAATSGNIGFLPFLTAALIAPNSAAIATVLLSVSGAELIAKRAPMKALFNVSQFVFAQSIAILCYLAAGGASILETSPAILPLAVLVGSFLGLNKLAVSTIVSTAAGRDTRSTWLRAMRSSVIYDLLAFPLIYVFAEVYVRGGALVAAALALPMLGVRQLYKTNVALEKMNEELLQLMVAAIEARDPYTSGHSQRVARFARVIARSAGLGSKQTERIAVAALLHDVGKIHEEFAPILRKPGRLTDAEFEIMKSHPEKGAKLIGKVTHFADLVPLVESHHESWHGRGYPKRLKEDEIPYGARIIALADTIDAMSTSRPYREALGAETVRAEIVAESGRQFDPRLCEALLQPLAWAEIVREIGIATSEYPVAPPRSDVIQITAATRLIARG
jgi:putative nucleotidyltransferase with HDIG domain